MVNYYDILGIAPTSSSGVIRKAYIQQSKKWHPDGFDQKGDESGWVRANQRFQLINEAYSCLRDTARRGEHDTALGFYWREAKSPTFVAPSIPKSQIKPEYVRSKVPFNSVVPERSMPVADYLRTFIERPGGFWRNYLKSLSWDNRIALILLILMAIYVCFRILFLTL